VGIRVDDSAVDAAERNIARQNQLDVAGLRKSLLADGVDPAGFRARVRDQLLLGRLREREVESRIRVTDADIDRDLSDLQAKARTRWCKKSTSRSCWWRFLRTPPRPGCGLAGPRARACCNGRGRARTLPCWFEQFSDAQKANGGQMGMRRGDPLSDLVFGGGAQRGRGRGVRCDSVWRRFSIS